MNTSEAKRIIRNELAKRGLSNKLTAKTFQTLDGLIFVKIHEWKPDPVWEELSGVAKINGFRLEASGVFIL
jgi:hypothetical protein